MCATAPSWIKLKSAHYYIIFCIVRVCENSCVCVLIVHKKETVTCSKINKWPLFLFAVRRTSQSASSRPNRIVTQSQGTPRQFSWSHESRVSTSTTSKQCIVLLLVPSVPWKPGLLPLPLHWHERCQGGSGWPGGSSSVNLVSHIYGEILLPIKVWNAPLFAPKTVSVEPN